MYSVAGSRPDYKNRGRNQNESSMASEIEFRKHNCDYQLLMTDFETDKISIEADWNEWLKKTSF
jgi:hypothetical protein